MSRISVSTIKATVRNGRIETDGPIDLPEGTELVVYPAAAAPPAGIDDRDPEERAQSDPSWLEWFDSLEPLLLTPEDEQAIAAARRDRKEWDLAHADERAEKLRRMWE